jgi:transposase, IS30 family
MGQVENSRNGVKWKQLSERERYAIEALKRAEMSVREIARQLGRNRRTIQRELLRGHVTQNVDWELKERYCADYAQMRSRERAETKGRSLKIGHCHALAKYLEQKIVREGFSPDAALNGAKEQGLTFEVSICTKTLYNYIGAGVFAGISNRDLPVKRDGKKRGYQPRQVALNNVRGRSIEERPKEVNERREAGHWEMDCVESGRGGKACLLVLTERVSRKEHIFKMEAKTQECVVKELDRLERRHKNQFAKLFKSITVDNGPEFLSFTRLEASSRVNGAKRTTLYYAHPYSAWERGSNENANRLIRRFIPKGTDIGKYSKADIRRIERWLNQYPRRLLGYKTPDQVLTTSL